MLWRQNAAVLNPFRVISLPYCSFVAYTWRSAKTPMRRETQAARDIRRFNVLVP